MKIVINDLHFKQTSSGCPEQYDVCDANGNITGYVRLRWGELTCDYPDCGGEEIYSASIGDGYTGSFTNDLERKLYLTTIANRILDKRNETKGYADDNIVIDKDSEQRIELMKIYVNKTPNKPEECLFSRRRDGYMYCLLSDTICKLSRGGKCNKLAIPHRD